MLVTDNHDSYARLPRNHRPTHLHRTMSSSSSNDVEASRVNLFLHAENVRIFDNNPQSQQLPVTIVTGFLGAGKTTLLQHILSNQSNLRIAAAINDFAQVSIDENLIRHRPTKSGTASRLVELSNGCVCCHLLDDLQAAVWKLLDRGGEVDMDVVNYLVVETSGISDPSSIIRTLDAKFGKCFRARLDSVVVVVDADQLLSSSLSSSSSSVEPISPAAVAQLQYADVVLINKMDLLPDPETDGHRVEEMIRQINTNAAIYKTRQCKVPLSAILDVQLSSSSSGGEHSALLSHEVTAVPFHISTTGGSLRCPSSLVSHPSNRSTMSHFQDGDDAFVSVSASVPHGPLALHKLQHFVTSPLVQRLARMKGVVWIQGNDLREYRCVVHLSGRGRLGFALDGKWTGPPLSQMAFIGRSSVVQAQELLSEFAKCCSVGSSGMDEKMEVPKNPRSETRHGVSRQDDNFYLNILRNSQEFVVLEDDSDNNNNSNQGSSCGNLYHFRLTGSKLYGFTEEEMERDLRIDTDAMNIDLVNAVNASVFSVERGDDHGKAFLVYTRVNSGPVVLCYAEGSGEPGNNLKALFREARAVLTTHFRNVQVCKCGV
jgi:G3E family GTPase